MFNRECYAHSLGNCEGGLSKEHIFSSCVLDPIVYFKGTRIKLPQKGMSKDNAVAKILCKKHNSLLSEYDAEAGKFVTALSFVSDSMKKGITKNCIQNTQNNLINGKLLERWFLKTAINTSFIMGGNHEYISKKVLNYLFGDEEFQYPYGLSLVDNNNDIKPQEMKEMECAPIITPEDGELSGFGFTLKGTHYILWFPWAKKEVLLAEVIVLEDNPVLKKLSGYAQWHYSPLETFLFDENTQQEYCIQRIHIQFND